MSSILGLLVGHKIQRVEKLYDYLQLWFDNGIMLNIFNIFTMIGFESDAVSLLAGCEVCAINESDEGVEFVFLGGMLLRVGLQNNDYQGPEAIEFIGKGGERVIW